MNRASRASCILATVLLSAASQAACASTGEEEVTLAELWAAEPDRTNPSVPALEPQSIEAYALNELNVRRTCLESRDDGRRAAGEALEPLPALSVEAHRERVQSVAAWSSRNPTESEPWAGVVTDLLNPKTFYVEGADGSAPKRVSLYGVQAPYPDQPFGEAAMERVAAALASSDYRVVVVPVTEKPRIVYGLVLLVRPDGGVDSLGEELLRHGLGWWNERYAGLDQRLEELHYGARDAGLGIFSDQRVISPHAFERIRRRAEAGDFVFEGEVLAGAHTEVIEGDTLRARLAPEHLEQVPGLEEYAREEDGSPWITIRLAGVDAPEIDQPGGVEAWALAHLACHGTEVDLVLIDDGGFGRVAARVIPPSGESVGELLVRAGWARHFEYYQPDVRLARLQERARQNGSGLWSSPDSISPGVWRDVQRTRGYWEFVGGTHYLVYDADGDPDTLGDQERLTSDQYRERVLGADFEDLCRRWQSLVSTGA